MAGQEQVQPQRGRAAPDEPPAAPDPVSPQVAARKASLDAGIDSVLDEIDGVLEINAEAFVAGFIQKGGQ